MVKGKGKNARQTRNLLLKMSSDKLMGPSNALKEWKVQRKRVKVSEWESHRSYNFILFSIYFHVCDCSFTIFLKFPCYRYSQGM